MEYSLILRCTLKHLSLPCGGVVSEARTMRFPCHNAVCRPMLSDKRNMRVGCTNVGMGCRVGKAAAPRLQVHSLFVYLCHHLHARCA